MITFFLPFAKAPTDPTDSFSEDLRTRVEGIDDPIVRERVLKGLKKLHEVRGPAALDGIDPTTLRMESGESCVLGQLYLSYGAGIKALGWFDPGADDPWAGEIAEAHGFVSSRGIIAYKQLTSAWKLVLTA